MSFTSVNVPTLLANDDNMKDFLSFVYTHELLLKQYGAIKIIPPVILNEIYEKPEIKLILPSTIQQIKKSNSNDFIYSIDTVPYINENISKKSLNEDFFCLLLSNQFDKQQQLSSMSIMPNHSLFPKQTYNNDFNIHQLPRQSLLKLCNNTILNQFVPTLTHTYGPCTIFPLSSSRQRLFSFNYHHEGGDHYWYIIPASERKILEGIFQQLTPSICFEHRSILMNPLIFDKYNIRYYQITQKPNEIVVLSAGALSQSFTNNESWSETINFALPSWINDGHANAGIFCTCNTDKNSLENIIDTNLFDKILIEEYVASSLNIFIDNESSSNTDEENMEVNENKLSNSKSVSFNYCAFKIENIDDNGNQIPCKISKENNLRVDSNNNTYVTPSNQWQTSVKSIDDFYEENISKSTNESCYLSSQEILNVLTNTPNKVRSIGTQIDEQFDDHKYNISNHQSFPDKSTQMNYTQSIKSLEDKITSKIDCSSTILLMSGIRNDVTRTEIRRYFANCASVKLKHNYSPPYNNYAFIKFRTPREAEFYRRRPINYNIFGYNCHIEYSKKNSHLLNEQYDNAIWNVIVRQIPENVTEEYLHQLFVHCESMKFTPARAVFNKKSSINPNAKNKVLWGYAFLHYPDTEKAAEVVNNANNFKINEQPLIISYYDKTISSRTKNNNNNVHQSSEYSQTCNIDYQ